GNRAIVERVDRTANRVVVHVHAISVDDVDFGTGDDGGVVPVGVNAVHAVRRIHGGDAVAADDQGHVGNEVARIDVVGNVVGESAVAHNGIAGGNGRGAGAGGKRDAAARHGKHRR